MKLSFVIPVYNERATLETLVDEIMDAAEPWDYTIYFVDDGSTDGSLGLLKELAARHSFVEVLRLPRHRGKSAALDAGFASATGDVLITMDSDGQDDPKELPRFLEKLSEGFDMVCGWKAVRHDPWHKTAPSRVYNVVVGRLFGLDLHDVNCGYKAMTIETAKRISLGPGLHRLIPVLAARQDLRISEIGVEHRPRRHGKSKYGISRFFVGAFDVSALFYWLHFSHRKILYYGAVGGGSVLGGFMLPHFGAVLVSLGAAWILAGIIAETSDRTKPFRKVEFEVVDGESR